MRCALILPFNLFMSRRFVSRSCIDDSKWMAFVPSAFITMMMLSLAPVDGNSLPASSDAKTVNKASQLSNEKSPAHDTWHLLRPPGAKHSHSLIIRCSIFYFGETMLQCRIIKFKTITVGSRGFCLKWTRYLWDFLIPIKIILFLNQFFYF